MYVSTIYLLPKTPIYNIYLQISSAIKVVFKSSVTFAILFFVIFNIDKIISLTLKKQTHYIFCFIFVIYVQKFEALVANVYC